MCDAIDIKQCDMILPTIHVKTLYAYSILDLMFTIYKTKVFFFFLWYMAKNHR